MNDLFAIPSVLLPAGAPADAQAEVTWVVVIGAAVVFFITMAMLLHASRHAGRPLEARRWIVGGGIIFPVLVLIPLGIYSVIRDRDASVAGAPPLLIGVTGHLWWWDVIQHDPGSGQRVRLANEVHIPAGRTVQLGLGSADVIHSFWVPQLGGKVDMVPGRINHLRLRAARPGVYRGQCAEFCGTQHARMVLHVVAHDAADYERWIAREAKPALPPGDALSLQGRQAFVEHGCAACHAIRGVSEQGRLGPDLTHVGSRLALGAGVLRNHPGAPAAWITGVQALKSSAHMPAYADIDAPTLNALGAYLSGLR